MRIKEEIKRAGEFWLPSSPANQVSGTLSISDGGNVKLELRKPLDPSIQAQLGPTHPDSLNPILGHIEKDGPVWIDQCYRVSHERNFTHGRLIGPLVVWANRAFIKLPYEEEEERLCFNTFSFSVEGIDEWVGISGIEVDNQFENSSTTIIYNRPEDISLNLNDDMQLLITFAWKSPGFPSTKRAEVSQKTFFKLISKKARELDEFTAIASKITAFLCFVMNEIVCLDSISATNNDLRQSVGNGRTAPIPVEIYCRTWPYAKDEPVINELNMLFGFEEKQSRIESLINKWLENYERFSPVFDLYLLARTGTLPLNFQFLTLVRALEFFHRRTSSRRKIKLKYRIQELIESFDYLIDDERRPQLIDRIVDTRHYLTHDDSKLEQRAAKGRVLEFLCIKMNALFRLQFLKLIGFDEQKINAIVDKCPYFKGECNLGRSLPDE